MKSNHLLRAFRSASLLLGGVLGLCAQNQPPATERQEIFRGIQESEYSIRWQPELGTYSCPNRAQRLRSKFFENGFTTEPRVPNETNNWTVSLGLSAISGHPIAPGLTKASPNANKLELEKSAVVFQYSNEEKGMRQSFLVQRKEGNGSLRLDLDVVAPGLTLGFDESEKFAFLEDNQGRKTMRYSDLHAWDAKGRVLPASMRAAGTQISLVVDDTDAVYPVLVDPISSTFIDETGPESGDEFGFAIAVSKTMVEDPSYFSTALIVGAPNYDNGGVDRGAVFVYYGSSIHVSYTPSWYAYGTQNSALFGSAVAAADVNGDSYDDLVAGASKASSSGFSQNGAIYVWHATTGGVLPVPAGGLPSSPEVNATAIRRGPQNSSSFGAVVINAGLPSSSPIVSVAVGAPDYTYGGTQNASGLVQVFAGSSSGLATAPSNLYGDSSGGQASERFGAALAGVRVRTLTQTCSTIWWSGQPAMMPPVTQTAEKFLFSTVQRLDSVPALRTRLSALPRVAPCLVQASASVTSIKTVTPI